MPSIGGSCTRMSSCVRRAGHAGACTAAPSAATLDWDDHKAEAEVRAELLQALDFPAPRWADLLDEGEAA